MMRTTVNLPRDVYEAARSVAQVEQISLGEAIAELVRRGLRPNLSVHAESGFPTFPVRPGAEPITLEATLAAEDEE
jgi:hypothetical protein